MKKMKINLSVVAIVLAMTSTFAFKPATNLKMSGEEWFEFTNQGGSGDGDASKPANYSLYGDGQSAPECEGSGARCAVQALPNAANPQIPDQNSLNDASGSQVKSKDN